MLQPYFPTIVAGKLVQAVALSACSIASGSNTVSWHDCSGICYISNIYKSFGLNMKRKYAGKGREITHLCTNARNGILGMTFYDAISRINCNELQSPAVSTPS